MKEVNGIYETIRCYKNKVWNYAAHYRRLNQSAQLTGLNLSISKSELLSKITKKLNQTGFTNSRIRLTLKHPNQLTIDCNEIPNKKLSSKLVTFKGSRQIPQIKNNDRLIEEQGLLLAQQQNALDAILINSKNQITEGTITNFFAVKNNIIYTAKSSILPGTTRAKVIKIARKLNLKIVYKKVHLNQLSELDECFVCNSIKQIVPIFRIDQHQLKRENPVTQTIKEMFDREFEEFCNQ
jgi:branched-subunit amino acid aminotransferase/4-amino-4-deoxychorismate lyase